MSPEEAASQEWPDDGRFRVFSASYCGYCRAALAALRDGGFDVDVYDVTVNRRARKVLQERTGMRTVPQIWHGATFVGGYSELVPYLARLES